LLGHLGGGLLAVAGRLSLEAKHLLQRPGQALTDGAGLAGVPAALDGDEDVEAAAHLHEGERPGDGVAVLVLGEVGGQLAAGDLYLAAALPQPDPRHRGLAPPGAEVVLLLGLDFRHGSAPHQPCWYSCGSRCGCWAWCGWLGPA